MKLYGVRLSQPCRSVAWTLLQLHIPFQFELAVPGIASKIGTHHELFKKLTTYESTQVPLLTYDDHQHTVVLTESPYIMAHLCEIANSPLYPRSGTIDKANVDSYLHWHHANTRLLAKIFQTKVRPDITATLSKDDELRIELVLKSINSGWLESSPYIGGLHTPTIADILAYGELSTVTMTSLIQLDPGHHSNLLAWMERLSKLPYHEEAHRALAASGDLQDDSNLSPISKRLGKATKAGLQGFQEAQVRLSSLSAKL